MRARVAAAGSMGSGRRASAGRGVAVLAGGAADGRGGGVAVRTIVTTSSPGATVAVSGVGSGTGSATSSGVGMATGAVTGDIARVEGAGGLTVAVCAGSERPKTQ
jgi:hypothetical protein